MFVFRVLFLITIPRSRQIQISNPSKSSRVRDPISGSVRFYAKRDFFDPLRFNDRERRRGVPRIVTQSFTTRAICDSLAAKRFLKPFISAALMGGYFSGRLRARTHTGRDKDTCVCVCVMDKCKDTHQCVSTRQRRCYDPRSVMRRR